MMVSSLVTELCEPECLDLQNITALIGTGWPWQLVFSHCCRLNSWYQMVRVPDQTVTKATTLTVHDLTILLSLSGPFTTARIPRKWLP